MALDKKKTQGSQVAGAGAGAGGSTTNTASASGAKRANKEVIAKGSAIIAQMSDEEKANLGSKSDTLHFVHLLGLASKQSRRKVSRDSSINCSTPVAVVLKTDIDIEVPVIDILKNKDTGVNPQTDITYRKVKAGETFDLSYTEFMFLILRDEYAGFLSANGVARGAYFSPKFSAWEKGEQKLPTPTIHLRSGSVKEGMVDIDQKNASDKWEIKPEFERYAGLLRKARPTKPRTTSATTPAPQLVAVALNRIINGGADVDAPEEAK